MRPSLCLLVLLVGLAGAGPVVAQRLLWEQSFPQSSATSTEGALVIALAGNQRFMLAGAHSLLPLPPGPGCPPRFRAYYRVYELNGNLVYEKPGSGLAIGNMDYVLTGAGTGWTTAAADGCVSGQRYASPLIQHLTLAGDTGHAWSPVLPPPSAYSTAILAQGNKLVTGGYTLVSGQPGQLQQFQLTCSDTLGHVRWQHSYPRLPRALDEAAALVPTPRGGYLLSGDAYNFTAGYDHYVLETDSLGVFRRSRIIQPLGPGYNRGSRLDTQCNALVLPHGGGYLLSGVADSVSNSVVDHQVGYLMRLDTALNVTWVYRHPPGLSGTGATQNNAYRIRLLPNGTVGLFLTDVRLSGTPDIFLAQVDIATGQRVAFYTLSSNTQAIVIPADWQWVGDGTLLLCGQARLANATYLQSYVARWDFSRTPLAARTADEASALAVFYCYPNPATGPVTVNWQLPVGQRAGQVRLYSVLGQLVRTVTLPATASGKLDVSGLAAGLYVARLVDAGGAMQGHAQRLEVRE